MTRKCTKNQECIDKGVCDDGYCIEPSWCSDYYPQTHYLEGVENFLIWFQGNIKFIQLAYDEDFTTMDENNPVLYPDSGANTYLVSDILDKAGTKLEDIRETGAVLRVVLDWDCDVTYSFSCSPDLSVDRLDSKGSGDPLGFSFDKYLYYNENNISYRDHQNVTGIRIVVESSGRAYAFTIDAIILNISSALSLTTLVPRIVDFIMLYILDSNLYTENKQYSLNKFKTTEDVGDALANRDQAPEEEEGPEQRDERLEENEESVDHFRA